MLFFIKGKKCTKQYALFSNHVVYDVSELCEQIYAYTLYHQMLAVLGVKDVNNLYHLRKE